MDHFIVVGAGQAGQSLVAQLRTDGFEGPITLLGSEPVPPYQRPPLSKAYLLGDMALERLYLRADSYYTENQIDLRLGEPVTGIDTVAKRIFSGGKEIAYDQLALTTGAVPRRLPDSLGGNLSGVYTIRTLADVDAMAPEFQPERRVLVVGGGYIGLEAAAVARKKGLKVTLVEMADRILQRVAAPQTAIYIAERHRKEDVDLREGVGLEQLIGEGSVEAAKLTDGTTIDVDFVIVGVGVEPDTALAKAAGLDIENGIKTDEYGRTSDPHVWAAGDCASFPYQGTRVRLESVGNAIDQGEAVARNMVGANSPYVAKPWFWSDQYDMKLQIAGLNTGYDHVVERPGEHADGLSFWYYNGPTLLAVDAINDPRAYMVGKRLIEAGKSPNADVLVDPSTDLKSLLRG